MGNKISDIIRRRVVEEMTKRKWNQVKLSSRLREIIISRIERELSARNWTHAELSKRSGISQGHVNNLMTGKRRFYDEQLEAMAQAFGIPIEKFLADISSYPGQLPAAAPAWLENDRLHRPGKRTGMELRHPAGWYHVDSLPVLAGVRRIPAGHNQGSVPIPFHNAGSWRFSKPPRKKVNRLCAISV